MVTEMPLPELLRAANRAGATFRLAGSQLRVTAPKGEALKPVLAALKARQAAVWDLLGGSTLDAPPLELIAKLGVEAVVPRTVEEAHQLITEMEADSDEYTPEAVERSRGGLLGLDIETATDPGEEQRPAARLRLKDGLPAKHQPALKGGAGLDPHRSTIRLVQLYGGGKRCLVLDTTLVPIGLLGDVIARRVMVIHNAGFELRFLTEAGLEIPLFEDTMQAAGLLLGVHRRSLEEVADAYLGVELPKGLQRSDWSAPCLSPGQIAYAALDAIVAFRLWLRLRLELHEKQRAPAYVLQRDVTPATVRMTARGITLDRAAHRQQILEWQAVLEAARKLFTEGSGQPPPATPAQTRAFLTRALPPDVIEAWPRTGKQQALSIKAADLKRHVSVPAIRALLAVNAMTKLNSSFGEELAAKVSAKSGRLHPTYNIASTKAGRFSASNPNIQQIPKHKAKGLRAGFIAAPGMKLVIADYSAMELRAAAAIAEDQAMNADFANGIDLHRRQAAEMLGIPQDEVTAQQRDTAKPICFGTIYGAGPRGLAASAWQNYGLVLSESDAEISRQAFLARYPDVAAWMDANFVQSNRRGFIAIGRLGRVIEASWEHQQRIDGRYNWRFPDNEDEEIDEEDARQRPPLQWQGVLKRTLCCNAPVQGACADAAMLALTWIDAALIEAGISGGPVLFVHDEIVLEVPEADAERAGALLVDCMTRAFAATFPNAPLTHLVELKIKDAWGASGSNHTAVGSTDRGIPDRAERRHADAVAVERGSSARGCDRAGPDLAVDAGDGAELSDEKSLYRRENNSEIWLARFANYERVRGRCCYLTLWPDGWVTGGWSLGGNYKRHADYHGAYPITLLKNIDALFFDRGRVLHVFSGALDETGAGVFPGDTLDINPARYPTYCVDAETCAGVPLHHYQFALVDPPYTDKDAAIYGTKPINRSRVLGTLAKGLPSGALIVWLDEITPPYRKDWPIVWEGLIAVSTSGGHRARVLFVYQIISR